MNATALGIHPPHTVHVAVDGETEDWAHDWPHEAILVELDAITVINPNHGNRLVRYPYVHAARRSEGFWEFTGGENDFTITAGPVTPLSMDTNGPANDRPGWDPDE